MDSPQQFLKDVIAADEQYALSMDTDLLIGNTRISEYMHFSEDLAEKIIHPFVSTFLSDVKRAIPPISRNIDEIIDNPPECIKDRDVYQGVQYAASVEGPYTLQLIRRTFLKDEVQIPPGTEEFMKKISEIPLCEDAYFPDLGIYAGRS